MYPKIKFKKDKDNKKKALSCWQGFFLPSPLQPRSDCLKFLLFLG